MRSAPLRFATVGTKKAAWTKPCNVAQRDDGIDLLYRKARPSDCSLRCKPECARKEGCPSNQVYFRRVFHVFPFSFTFNTQTQSFPFGAKAGNESPCHGKTAITMVTSPFVNPL
jgi:hypothetical protein